MGVLCTWNLITACVMCGTVSLVLLRKPKKREARSEGDVVVAVGRRRRRSEGGLRSEEGTPSDLLKVKD